MQTQTGEQLRDAGMQQAIYNADTKINKWSEIAYNFLLSFIETNDKFMVEDVRFAATNIIPIPPSLRAWGAIIIKAAKANKVRRIGFQAVTNSKAHSTPASLWIKI